MKQKWQLIAEKFDELSQRERVLVAVAAIVVTGLIVYLPLESAINKHSKLTQQNQSIESENRISTQQIALYEQSLQQDPDTEYRQRLHNINQQNKKIDEQLSVQMVDMVPADHMPTLLAGLLSKVNGITLQSFTSIAPKPLLEVGDEKKINLYSHGIRLELVGDYFSVLRFIEAVEAMPNKLYWRSMDYRVDAYPKATISLELYTLSINKDFISVAKKD
ncbi:MSHA biogenesis protein MshJ [Shewanella fidelis]|uniref:MSHA biogenesis protein MshJ n=1 Tax=Shewanella fidelis TaxID=173509 RepID=A0AAW8NFM6_9GAMM|nr:MSHA biogenesis protein MshJ [Shewanella fidelis]MDR8522149.1 MSHA biogenesis protein MshJ [Shewanella fidelis]MDW4812636.1 MSHA biogenesis protein MshJ [Shewanella fidelis]MDW4816384.1 MSHA biogenesis protein MshJ [Shewanella fidelis]MDW4820877.1 MSHA biogenesis protein MshJ [Shewanella fidelis]MDW4825100.1 MSHA biogenesis protein MshJ [Shewanella fidelis]